MTIEQICEKYAMDKAPDGLKGSFRPRRWTQHLTPGICQTPGCEKPSRWISVFTWARSRVRPLPYHCADCCDEIADAMEAVALVAAGQG